MEQNETLADKFDQEDAVLKQLRWSAWLDILNFIGFICVVVVLAMHNRFSNGDSFKTLFTISIACFGMTYVFSAIMLLLSYRLLDSFDNKQYVRLIKIIGFIPLANISMIYFVSALSYQKKKSIKDIVDNGK